MTILAIGAYTEDRILYGDRLPGEGESVAAREALDAPGGKAANVAVAASRLGATVRLLASVGDDAEGVRARELLDAEGVADDIVVIPGARTGRCNILVDDAGSQVVMTFAGASDDLPARAVGDAVRSLSPGDILVLQGEVRGEVNRVAIETSPAGVTVVLNPSPVEPYVAGGSDFSGVSVLVLNEAELRHLARARSQELPEPAEPADILDAARAVAGHETTVVVTRGARGAWVLGPDVPGGLVEVDAPATHAIDSTGAGDAFIGGLIAALQFGHPILAASEKACAVASYSVAIRGCIPSYPHPHDLAPGVFADVFAS
jgi:ribokinase